MLGEAATPVVNFQDMDQAIKTFLFVFKVVEEEGSDETYALAVPNFSIVMCVSIHNVVQWILPFEVRPLESLISRASSVKVLFNTLFYLDSILDFIMVKQLLWCSALRQFLFSVVIPNECTISILYRDN